MCRIAWRRINVWLPAILASIIVSWSYTSYVMILYRKFENYIQLILYLIVYHMITAMFLWSYYKVIVTPIPTVPEKFKLPTRELARLMLVVDVDMEDRQNVILEEFCRNLPIHNRTEKGRIRFCDICKQIKPDRAHHCSTCRKCVLKMDHHCEWVNNCVCFSNYKYFILFAGYSATYCLFISATTYDFFIMCLHKRFKDVACYDIVALISFAVVFAIVLSSLFFYHIYLICVNRTTIETRKPPVFINGPDKNGYNLGIRENFRQVFGSSLPKCFIPVFTSTGNGDEFPFAPRLQV